MENFIFYAALPSFTAYIAELDHMFVVFGGQLYHIKGYYFTAFYRSLHCTK